MRKRWSERIGREGKGKEKREASDSKNSIIGQLRDHNTTK